MRKARLTLILEMDLDPQYYEDGTTPEEMLKNEVDNANDPSCLFELLNDFEYTVTGELIDA